jgi:hypothetical protein
MALFSKNRFSPNAKSAFSIRLLILFLALVLGGCASNMTLIAPQPPDHFTKLGHAEGKACGSMLAGTPTYNFIPVYLNSRVERAYQQAVESVPGATALGDVTIQENWYWWLIGTTRCTIITGEAIR